jgi:hypothetical protein
MYKFHFSVQLFPSWTRIPRGQMAPRQLLVSQYIWRHSWNDRSDGTTSSSYTEPLFRTFLLVLVCLKQNLMCENKIKLSSFTAPCWSLTLIALLNATLPLPHLDLRLILTDPDTCPAASQWGWQFRVQSPCHPLARPGIQAAARLRNELHEKTTPIFHQWSLWVRPSW